MRIVSWNCCRGPCLVRAAQLAGLEPDIVVLQECARPEGAAGGPVRWFGENAQQGVAVIARDGYQLVDVAPAADMPDSVFAVRVVGPVSFALLAVWTHPLPTYVGALDRGLSAYGDLLRGGPAVVMGDFNSHWRFDKPGQSLTHAATVERLRRDFGLVSAYHAAHPDVEFGAEPATLYWQWRETQPFHIDYCFLPQHWVPHVRSATVGSYAQWEGESDHRPLLVDIDVPDGRPTERVSRPTRTKPASGPTDLR